jgi:hypothetical protein
MRDKFSASLSFYRERLGSEHAFAKPVAKAINLAVIGAHSLLHDLRCDTYHVRVSDLSALYNFYDRHASAQFAGLRIHTQDANIGGFKSVQNRRGRRLYRPHSKIFEKQAGTHCMNIIDSGREACRDLAAWLVRD